MKMKLFKKYKEIIMTSMRIIRIEFVNIHKIFNKKYSVVVVTQKCKS